MSERAPFDAQAHMRKIRTRQGMQDYLDVKWRLAWLRSDFPEARIVTEKVAGGVAEGYVEFLCTITLPNGAVATGYGTETKEDFPDYPEKGETKSIGRACAVLGYGTDAAVDFDDGEPLDGAAAGKGERAARTEGGNVATSAPVRREAPAKAESPPATPAPHTEPDVANIHQLAQLRSIAAAGYDLAGKLKAMGGIGETDLTREQAKELIIEGRASIRRNPHAG